MTGYDFHPEAVLDIEDIWDYTAQDNPDAADKVTADILAAIEAAVAFRSRDSGDPTSPHARCAFCLFMTI